MTTLMTRAIAFAANAHDGMTRRGKNIPYILHPMEAAAIAATLTDDEEVIAAAVLHDVIEDCRVTASELAAQFGDRVAELVLWESQTMEGNPRQTWGMRKHEAVMRIGMGCREVKIIALADKLSNMRSIRQDYLQDGEAIFQRFHQNDKRTYGRYYCACVESLRGEMSGTAAFEELERLVTEVFGASDDGREEQSFCVG